MKRRLQVLVIGLLCGLIISLIIGRVIFRGVPSDPSETEPAATVSVLGATVVGSVARIPGSVAREPTSTVSSVPLRREKLDAQTLARVQDLEKMEAEKRQREQSAQKTREAREEFQRKRHRAWMEVVQAQKPVFDTLRAQAIRSPDKKVPCSICDTKGILDLCVVCDHTGKCPTCLGTGKVYTGICPTCQGSGKCFLCHGLGKMSCPFCQSLPLEKEVITPDTPEPLIDFPID